MRNINFVFIFCFLLQSSLSINSAFGQEDHHPPDDSGEIGQPGAFSEVDTIFVRNHEFEPDSLTISVGDSVVFYWESGDHTTSSHDQPPGTGPWHQHINAQQTSWLMQLTTPGEYHYHSMNYPDIMTGVIVVEDDEEVTSVNTSQNNQKKYIESVYPNPASDVAQFRISKEGHGGTLRVTNIIGEEMESVVVNDSEDTKVNVSAYPEGIYIYTLEIDNQSKVSGKFIVNR
ncbi:T9SS type A sorting domain-containing protein [Cytophagaceae bacterium ABcell3]|nr:T9SS type A sorting domain-containing protein [Cytophagaceae bacterium ABcell3]